MNNFKLSKINLLRTIAILFLMVFLIPQASVFATEESYSSTEDINKNTPSTYNTVIDSNNSTAQKIKSTGSYSNTNLKASAANGNTNFASFIWDKITSAFNSFTGAISNIINKIFGISNNKESNIPVSTSTDVSNNNFNNTQQVSTTTIDTSTPDTSLPINNISTEQIKLPAETVSQGSTQNQVQGSNIEQGPTGKTGPRGPTGPQGPKGKDGKDGKDGNSIDASSFVSKSFFDAQVSGIYNSLDNSIKNNSNSSTSESSLTFTSPLSKTSNSVSLKGLTGFGTAGQVVRTNATLDGLEWGDVAGGAGVNGVGTTNQLSYWVNSNTLGTLSVSTYPSLVELSYIKGLTSSVQTQLDSKQASGSYLTSYTETDPIFVASQAHNITSGNITNLSNLSGTNSGDNAINSLYSGLAASKQNTLVSATNIKTINGNSLLGSGDLTISGGGSMTWPSGGAGIPNYNGSSAWGTSYTTIGSGTVLALATTPTFTTNITTPLILGGSTTTSPLTLQTTSGVGTTGADMHFKVGNNGATEAMTILNNGYVGIGTTSPSYKLDIAGGGLHVEGSGKFGTTTPYTGQKAIFFGDSTTEGATFSTPISASLGDIEVNMGISGSTMSLFSSRYSEIPVITSGNLNEYQYLFFDYGINDAYQGYSVSTYSTALGNAIDNAISKGWIASKIVVITPNYITDTSKNLGDYADAAIVVAKQKGTQYTNSYYYTSDNGGSSLLSDGVHPTSAGGLIMARSILSSIDGGGEYSGSVIVQKSVDIGGNTKIGGGLTTLNGIINSNNSTLPNGTVSGDLILPLSGAIRSSYTNRTDLYASFVPLSSSNYTTEINNNINLGNIDFNISGGVNEGKVNALNIGNTGIATFKFKPVVPGLDLGYSTFITSSGAGFTNEIGLWDSGNTTITNRYANGTISLTPGGATNGTTGTATRISNTGLSTVGLSLVYNNLISSTAGGFTNDIGIWDSGNTSINNRYANGKIILNPGGVTNGTLGSPTTISSTSLSTPSVISPTILGGSTTTSPLTLQTTSGVGTTGADMHFKVGNNGATEAMTILNNGYVGINTIAPSGLLSEKSTTALESAQLGAELTDTNSWTSTGWTGSYGAGFAHTTGNTTALSRTMTNTIGNLYQISFTVTGRTAGSFTVGLGGETSNKTFSATDTYAPKTLSTNGNLIFTPTTDFDGTISAISVRQNTARNNATYAIIDSLGNPYFEIYSSLSTLGNQFLGKDSGSQNTTGSNNTANGPGALNNNTSGSSNTANGFSSLYGNTTGNYNTATGVNTLQFNTTGSGNATNGAGSLRFNTTGNNNTANGAGALSYNATGSGNVASGNYALAISTTGNNNVANGPYSMYYNITGSDNTASGDNSLNNSGKTVTAGTFITGVSYTIITAGTTDFTLIGAANSTPGTVFTATGVGTGTGTVASNSNNNAAYGYNAGKYLANGSTELNAPSNSLFIGTNTRASADGLTNENVIGYGAIGSGSNTVTLGNNAITGTYFDGNLAKILGMNRHTTTDTAGNGLTLQSGGATLGSTNKNGGDLYIKSAVSTGTGTSNIHFFTGAAGSTGTTDNTPTEKMTILGSGFVGINKTNPSVALDVTGDIQYTGTITDVSDRRLKENFKPITGALDIVLGIQGTYFNKIATPGVTEAGFIAQNVQQYVPTAVSFIDNGDGGCLKDDGSQDRCLGVSYPELIPFSFEAIRELDLKIKDLSSLDTTSATSLGSLISNFLGNESSRIAKIFTKEIDTQSLCVSDATGAKTCINKNQLDELISKSGSTSTVSTGGSGSGSSGSGAGNATPADFCPNVEGNQLEADGPCKDTLCVLPEVWNINNQACEAPASGEQTDICPNVTGVQTEGTCADTLCSATETWNNETQTCDAPVQETPKCTATQTLVDNVCTAQITTTCTDPQVLKDGICVTP